MRSWKIDDVLLEITLIKDLFVRHIMGFNQIKLTIKVFIRIYIFKSLSVYGVSNFIFLKSNFLIRPTQKYRLCQT